MTVNLTAAVVVREQNTSILLLVTLNPRAANLAMFAADHHRRYVFGASRGAGDSFVSAIASQIRAERITSRIKHARFAGYRVLFVIGDPVARFEELCTRLRCASGREHTARRKRAAKGSPWKIAERFVDARERAEIARGTSPAQLESLGIPPLKSMARFVYNMITRADPEVRNYARATCRDVDLLCSLIGVRPEAIELVPFSRVDLRFAEIYDEGVVRTVTASRSVCERRATAVTKTLVELAHNVFVDDQAPGGALGRTVASMRSALPRDKASGESVPRPIAPFPSRASAAVGRSALMLPRAPKTTRVMCICITLQGNEERLQQMREHTARLDKQLMLRVLPAVDGRHERSLAQNAHVCEFSNGEMTPTEVATTLSHLRALDVGMRAGARYFIIAEDDVDVCPFGEPLFDLERVLAHLPNDFAIAQLLASPTERIPYLETTKPYMRRKEVAESWSAGLYIVQSACYTEARACTVRNDARRGRMHVVRSVADRQIFEMRPAHDHRAFIWREPCATLSPLSVSSNIRHTHDRSAEDRMKTKIAKERFYVQTVALAHLALVARRHSVLREFARLAYAAHRKRGIRPKDVQEVRDLAIEQSATATSDWVRVLALHAAERAGHATPEHERKARAQIADCVSRNTYPVLETVPSTLDVALLARVQQNVKWVFVGGVWRSCTSAITRALSKMPLTHAIGACGERQTHVTEGEGQFCQYAFPIDRAFGQPGDPQNPGINARAMDAHAADSAMRRVLTYNWISEWLLVARGSQVRMTTTLLEKSPMNMLRLPLLRATFPNARAIIVMRHPIAQALSIGRWPATSKADRSNLMLHVRAWIEYHEKALEMLREDTEARAMTLFVRVEDIACQRTRGHTLRALGRHLGSTITLDMFSEFRASVNKNAIEYCRTHAAAIRSISNELQSRLDELGCGYDIGRCDQCVPTSNVPRGLPYIQIGD